MIDDPTKVYVVTVSRDKMSWVVCVCSERETASEICAKGKVIKDYPQPMYDALADKWNPIKWAVLEAVFVGGLPTVTTTSADIGEQIVEYVRRAISLAGVKSTED